MVTQEKEGVEPEQESLRLFGQLEAREPPIHEKRKKEKEMKHENLQQQSMHLVLKMLLIYGKIMIFSRILLLLIIIFYNM